MSTKTKLGKMCCGNASSFISLSLLLILFCDTTSSECMQLAPCVCSLPDGNYYNLTGFANAEPFTDTKGDWTVYFHPCTNVKMKIGNITCANGTGVSLCLHNKEKNVTITRTVEETQMKMSPGHSFPVFRMYHEDLTLTVDIECRKDSTNKTSFVIDLPFFPETKEYGFSLFSPYGCIIQGEMGLSMGSVLVILFFVFTGVYFIGGIIVMKALRGATGWEMVPNHDFWCKLPSLVRDGVVFTFNCCRAGSYEQI